MKYLRVAIAVGFALPQILLLVAAAALLMFLLEVLKYF